MSTYSPIASVDIVTGATSVAFTGIPQTYSDLILVFSGQANTATGDYKYIQDNNDTGSNYGTVVAGGNGSATTTGTTFASRTNINIDYYGTPLNGEISNTTVQIVS